MPSKIVQVASAALSHGSPFAENGAHVIAPFEDGRVLRQQKYVRPVRTLALRVEELDLDTIGHLAASV